MLLLDKGDLVGAEPLLREALEARREVLSERHPNTLTSINDLATLLQAKGLLDEAKTLYEEALKARREVYGAILKPPTLGGCGFSTTTTAAAASGAPVRSTVKIVP